jgi:hypothetical protein
MPIFTPPTVNDRPSVLPSTTGVQRQLFRYYAGNPRGTSIVKVGGHYMSVDNPYADLLVGREGVDWFLGGHVYVIDDATAGALTGDGFGTGVAYETWGSLAGRSWATLNLWEGP